MKPVVGLALLCVLFLVAACGFNAATPYRKAGFLLHQKDPKTGGPAQVVDVGNPDERQHANYVAYLKAGKGFPVLVPGAPDAGENYEAHQPPLYYLLTAAWSSAFGLDPTSASSGFLLRLLNSLLGVATLCGIYMGVLWGFKNQAAALAATAFAALLPMNVALHAAMGNDPLLICTMTWATALVLFASVGTGGMKAWALACVFAGLALLTKTTGLALVPVLASGLVIGMRGPLKESKGQAAAACVVPVLLVSWWWMRNISLYGDPFALKVFDAAFGGSPKASIFIDGFGASSYWTQWVTWWTARSFVGAFGYMDIFLFESMRPEQAGALYNGIIFLLGLPMLAGLGFSLTDKENPGGRPAAAVVMVLLAVVVLFFVQFNLKYFQGQARYLFPALFAFSAFFGLGLARLMKGKADWAWLAAAVPLAVLTWVAYQAVLAGFPARLGSG